MTTSIPSTARVAELLQSLIEGMEKYTEHLLFCGMTFSMSQFSKALASAQNLEDMTQCIDKALTTILGLNHAPYRAYISLGTPTKNFPFFLCSNYPMDWIKYYEKEELWLIDPVLNFSKSNTTPFLWSEIDKKISNESFWRDAQRHSISRKGITIPISNKEKNVAYFSLTIHLTEEESFEKKIEQNFYLILKVVNLYHHRLLQYFKPHAHQIEKTLTAREYEIISWIVKGKTYWETGRILNISENTVIFHMNNIKRKLNVRSRTEAILKISTLFQ